MRYVYSILRLMVFYDKYCPVDQLHEAVEYIKTQPQTPFTGLQVSVSTTAGPYKLLTQPILPLSTICGKMPAQVRNAFDVEVDRWRKDLEARTSWTGI